jgi:hypothetical protein
MDNDPSIWLAFGGFAALVVLGAWGGLRARRKTHARMAVLAERLGLEFVAAKTWTDNARITGSVRGKRVEFFNYTTGSGKSRKSWSALSVAPATSGSLTFALCKQGFVTKVRALFGAKEITVGDKAFDDRWFIQTNQPDFFRAALIPELRAKLDAALSGAMKGGDIKLEAGAVRHAEQGGFSEERCARYEALLPLLCDLADVAEVSSSMS